VFGDDNDWQKMMYPGFGKRIFDLAVSSLGLLGLLPMMALVAVLVKFSSPGPVFFRQERMGKGGRGFRLFKFRTMSPGNGASPGFTPGNASRVTRIGRVLRETKLDEMPQLMNVLAGDLSLVGPRPEVPDYRSVYRGEFGKILEVRPGITDPASVKYRREESILALSEDPERTYMQTILPDKLRMDLEYVGNISFGKDLKILGTTFRSLLKWGEGRE
jgi:lipopolysaccharide/colanic/teichoic acid biosynthesis glycosyltransferase